MGDEGPPIFSSARFLTTFEFDREYLRKGSTYRKTEKYLINYHPSHVGSKKVGVLWSINEKFLSLMYIDNSVLFSGDYISALRGCCPLKFLHAQEIDQGLLAHTHKGVEGPPQKI